MRKNYVFPAGFWRYVSLILALTTLLPSTLWLLAWIFPNITMIIIASLYTLALLIIIIVVAINAPNAFNTLDSNEGIYYIEAGINAEGKNNVVGTATANPTFIVNSPYGPYRAYFYNYNDWDHIPMAEVKTMLKKNGLEYRHYKNPILEFLYVNFGLDYTHNIFWTFNMLNPVSTVVSEIQIYLEGIPTKEGDVLENPTNENKKDAKLYVNVKGEITAELVNGMEVLRNKGGFETAVKGIIRSSGSSAMKDVYSTTTYSDIETSLSEDSKNSLSIRIKNLANYGIAGTANPKKEEFADDCLRYFGILIREINRFPIKGANPSSEEALTITGKVEAEEGKQRLAVEAQKTETTLAETEKMKAVKKAEGQSEAIGKITEKTVAFHKQMMEQLGPDGYAAWQKTEAAKSLPEGLQVYAPTDGTVHGNKIAVAGFGNKAEVPTKEPKP
jgi:hypothetical protein